MIFTVIKSHLILILLGVAHINCFNLTCFPGLDPVDFIAVTSTVNNTFVVATRDKAAGYGIVVFTKVTPTRSVLPFAIDASKHTVRPLPADIVRDSSLAGFRFVRLPSECQEPKNVLAAIFRGSNTYQIRIINYLHNDDTGDVFDLKIRTMTIAFITNEFVVDLPDKFEVSKNFFLMSISLGDGRNCLQMPIYMTLLQIDEKHLEVLTLKNKVAFVFKLPPIQIETEIVMTKKVAFSEDKTSVFLVTSYDQLGDKYVLPGFKKDLVTGFAYHHEVRKETRVYILNAADDTIYSFLLPELNANVQQMKLHKIAMEYFLYCSIAPTWPSNLLNATPDKVIEFSAKPVNNGAVIKTTVTVIMCALLLGVVIYIFREIRINRMTTISSKLSTATNFTFTSFFGSPSKAK